MEIETFSLNRVHSAHSFWLGYNNARMGKITEELTNRQIQERWPKVNATAFGEGMLDGLGKDPWRYRIARQTLIDEGIIEVPE